MTLQASFPLSMAQIAAELQLALPLSINHTWVIALAGKSALPVSFSDLLGKTGSFNGSVTFTMGSGVSFGNVQSSPSPLSAFFGGTISTITTGIGNGSSGSINFDTSQPAPNWSGNIKITNQTAGASGVMTKQSAYVWSGSGMQAGTIPGGGLSGGQSTTATMLIQPSN